MKRSIEDTPIVFIGAGNLATNLAKALYRKGFRIVQVYSRTMESARTLAEKVEAEYTKLKKQGFPLDCLNIDYNIEEAHKKIDDIMTRAKDLNLEDSLFELKVLSDYFDSVFTDYEKEKVYFLGMTKV